MNIKKNMNTIQNMQASNNNSPVKLGVQIFLVGFPAMKNLSMNPLTICSLKFITIVVM